MGTDTRVAGYDLAQIENAAIIADVAQAHGLGDRGALLGVMCAMGESSLRNITFGDWETNGVRNPDGSPTISIGLFQQQASWGSVADRMDPLYAAWKFFDALRKVRDWATIAPTLAIHRTQINADPNHYAKYETPARAVLAAIPGLKASGLMAPTIEWLRPGAGYQPAAARSMRRLEARLGRAHDCNSSYRDYDEQMQMYNAWNRYVDSGYDPRYKPNHSRALHPDKSAHCMGLADDSDDWTTPGYIDLAAEYGWIRTAAGDPTERHHFEYQVWNDQHRNDPVPASVDTPQPPTEEEQIMGVKDEIVTELKTEVRTIVKEEIAAAFSARGGYDKYVLIKFADDNGRIDLKNTENGKRVRIGSPYHVTLIRRHFNNTGDDAMLTAEDDIVESYLAKVA